MLRTMRFGFITMAATLAVSAAPAAATQKYTTFQPDGTPVRAAEPASASFMDYTDDSCMALGPTADQTRRGLATRSGGEVCSGDSF